ECVHLRCGQGSVGERESGDAVEPLPECPSRVENAKTDRVCGTLGGSRKAGIQLAWLPRRRTQTHVFKRLRVAHLIQVRVRYIRFPGGHIDLRFSHHSFPVDVYRQSLNRVRVRLLLNRPRPWRLGDSTQIELAPMAG